MRLGGRGDVPDRDEAVGRVDVVAVRDEPAEEAVRLRQRRAPPRSATPTARAGTIYPTGASTSHGV